MTIQSKLSYWWYNHVQKTISSILGSLAAIDLASSLAGYQSEITSLLGANVYAGLRLLGAIGIFWRALQASHPAPLPPPDPNAVRS